jgi:hypothetical protein
MRLHPRWLSKNVWRASNERLKGAACLPQAGYKGFEVYRPSGEQPPGDVKLTLYFLPVQHTLLRFQFFYQL